MKEYHNFIIPDDVYHLILPKIKVNNINDLSKEEFLKHFDIIISEFRNKILNDFSYYQSIQNNNIFPDNVYYLVLSFNFNTDEKFRVCEMNQQQFLETFDIGVKDLRNDILSNDEYYNIL